MRMLALGLCHWLPLATIYLDSRAVMNSGASHRSATRAATDE